MSMSSAAEQLFPQDYNSEIELLNALNEALESIEKGTEPTRPQAKIFKCQMEGGNEPFLDNPDSVELDILSSWINSSRDRLDTILFGETEAKWFRRKN